ncbi:MAG: ATP-binding cassette domain-containing protein, partial [Gammaproteobacteria bacterium]
MGLARRRSGRRRFRLSVAAGGPALSVDAVYSLRNVTKTYGAGGVEFRLDISELDVPRGAKLALVGESGAGKSTLLELLAMILKPSEAERFLFRPLADGDELDVDAAWHMDASDRLSVWRSRHIGYVLQHGGLLPYLTVRRNIELSRRLLGLSLGNVAEELAARLGIEQQLDKLPAALSVGQRQRAAIARALAHEPRVLLLDEPFGALDAKIRDELRRAIRDIQRAVGITTILVTHDQEEAFTMADRIGVMERGRLQETDEPRALYTV